MGNVILIGMPGAGKSTVGVLLAKTMGLDFLDTDLVLQRQRGGLLQELVDTLGQEAFLDAEEAAVLTVRCRGTVVATGGSVIYREAGMRHLKGLGPAVYLRVPRGELEGRLFNMGARGIAMAPGQTFRALYAERAPLYAAWADLTVDMGGQTLEEGVQAVRSALDAWRPSR